MGDPKPSFSKTYSVVDGLVSGYYGWVTDLDQFDGEEDPVELIEETWVRTGVRTFWYLPDSLYLCAVGLDCDENAEDWRMFDGVPTPACVQHGQNLERVGGAS